MSPQAALLGAAALLIHPALAQDADQDTDDAIDEIVVTGSQVDLSGAYEGDQVARGARAGLLGNLSYLETPFSSTAYTETLARRQQAISVGDVLRNDPTVRTAKGFGNFQEVYVVRGLPVFSDDVTYNGLYGVLPRQFIAAELVERVEVFRGANALLNGAAPGGSGAGGLVNVVPKRAGEEPLDRFTLGVQSRGQLSGAVDVARRFGTDDAYGLRVGLARRDGETAVRDQDRDLTVLSLGTDYEGERLRFSADLGYQDQRLDAPRPQVTPLGAPPPVPRIDGNYAQPDTFTEERQLFGAFRGEAELTDRLTGWLAFGARRGEEENRLANPTATPEGLTTSFRFDNTREDTVYAGDAGLRAAFETGPLAHALTASASIVDIEEENAFAFSSFLGPFTGSLYEANEAVLPPADFFTGGTLGSPLTTAETTNTSYALVDTVEALDGRVRVIAGLRYQDIETTAFDPTTGEETSSYDADAFTPALAVVVAPTDGVALFANYAESLRPGQVAPAQAGGVAIENAGEVLDPFRGEQVEVGVKYEGDGYGLTLSAFTLDQTNAIVADGVFTDDGEQRNRGAELVVYGEPAPGLRVIAGATYLDAELTRTEDGVNEGNRAIGVPEFQANVNLDADVPGVPGLVADARLIHTGDQAIDLANTEEIGDWTRLDLGLRYEARVKGRPLTLLARAENVLREGYWASAGGFPGANYLVQGEPRTFLLSVSADL